VTAADSAQHALPAEPENEGNTAVNLARPTVLIVDDDHSLLGLLRAVFEEASFEVSAFTSARTALSHAIDRAPDVIVLDLEMPEMNGREFFAAVREAGVPTPVLILSAYGARQAGMEMGAQAHMNKPFEPDDLILAARSLVS
jgi:DNA-binding response OmpR family regulator